MTTLEKAMFNLINDIGPALCDATIGKIEFENDDEQFGGLMTLSYLRRLFLNRIIDIKKEVQH